MAKATTEIALTSTWAQIANDGQTFMLSVTKGQILVCFAAAQPGAGTTIGHPFIKGEHYGDTEPSQIAWARAINGGGGTGAETDAATISISKE